MTLTIIITLIIINILGIALNIKYQTNRKNKHYDR